MKRLSTLSTAVILAATTGCADSNESSTKVEPGNFEGGSIFEGELPGAISVEVSEEVRHNIDLQPENESGTPVDAPQAPLAEVEGELEFRPYQRPAGFPNNQDVYIFPRHATQGELDSGDEILRKIGSITRTQPVVLGEFLVEAEQEVDLDAVWNFRVNWINRGTAPHLTEEAIANTRWHLITTFDEGTDCEVILTEEDFVYLYRGGFYDASIDCGEVTLPQTQEGKTHRLTLVGEFPHVDDRGWSHHSLGGMYTNTSPEFEFEEGIDAYVIPETVAGRISTGRITFYETPQNEVVVVSMFPYGLTGRLQETLHAQRGYWGVVEGDPVRVKAADTSFSAGHHLRSPFGDILASFEWSEEEADATMQFYTLSFGSTAPSVGSRLNPSEDREIALNSLLKPDSCILNQECPLSDDPDQPDMYQQAAIDELGGEDCRMPGEVCAIAPAAFTAGISGSIMPNYESSAFLNPEDPRFGETWYSIEINSITSDAESITFVYRDGTKVAMDSEVIGGGFRVFTTPEGQRTPTIGDDHIETVFGTCISAEVDTVLETFEYRLCSCGDMEQELQNGLLVWVCPETEE